LDDIGGWLSDTLDAIPGVPNLADTRRMIENIAEFEMPPPIMTFAAAATSFAGDARLATGGLDAESSAALGVALGDVYTTDGLRGQRIIRRGATVAEVGFSGGPSALNTRGLNESGMIDVQVLYDNEFKMSSVTAVVTTERRDEVTMCMTTFDLDSPDGRRAAELVRDFAFAPGSVALDAEALDLIANDTTASGVNQTSQTFGSDSDQYGFGFSVPNPAVELGITAEVEVARLAPR
ncbi:MAG: hypothetical protein ACT4OX_15280, partial [Actinomycetota bacterium]